MLATDCPISQASSHLGAQAHLKLHLPPQGSLNEINIELE